MKKIVVILGIGIGIIAGWLTLFSRASNSDVKGELEAYKKLASEQLELEAYGSAIQYYQNIVSLEATEDNYLKLAEIYESAQKYRAYKETLEKSISMFPEDVRAYERLSEYYREENAYQDCVDVVRAAQKAGVLSEALLDDYYSTAYKYGFLTTGLGDAGRFYNSYAVVKINEKYMYINSGMETVSVQYEHASPYMSTVTGVTLGGETYYIDENGEKYLDNKEKCEKAYAYSEGISLVVIDGKYNYVSSSNQIIWEPYDMATLFKNGVAAVKRGDKWNVIDTSGNAVSKTSYTDVLFDEDNVCSNSGVIFVSEGKGYYMVDTEGKKISDTLFEDAKPFFESNITAVKKDGKWGFINAEGKIIIEPQYEDAAAFGRGIGAVKKDGKWGFVNAENRMVIEPEFEDAKCFSSNGIAPVKMDNTWAYIMLYVN